MSSSGPADVNTKLEEVALLIERGVQLATESHATSSIASAVASEYEAAVYKFLLGTFGPRHGWMQRIAIRRQRVPVMHPVELIGILRDALQELNAASEDTKIPFETLLHPVIRNHSYGQFLSGHYRDAVFNAIVAVFDLLRDRTGLPLDGSRLATEAFGSSPRLLIADVTTESGRNEQIGFMQMLQGAYAGVRNPKAHTVRHDTGRDVAAQYMIFASLLARRISEAKINTNLNLQD